MDFELSDEQRMVQRAVRDFCEAELKPYAAEVDEKGQLRWEAIRKISTCVSAARCMIASGRVPARIAATRGPSQMSACTNR